MGTCFTAVSNGMVALLKKYYGRGPTTTKSYYEDDVVVCVLRGGFSRVEKTLLEAGRNSAVMQQRLEFQDVMRERFASVVEGATERQVIGFISGAQKDPDLMCETSSSPCQPCRRKRGLEQRSAVASRLTRRHNGRG
jgi:uncharacterized protein YbcI